MYYLYIHALFTPKSHDNLYIFEYHGNQYFI